MTDLKIRKTLEPGLNPLVTDQLEFLRFSILRLSPGERFEEALSGWECVLALLSGECEIRAGAGVDGKKLGPRRNVFDDPPWGVYVPGDGSYEVRASTETELALSYAPWKSARGPLLVTPAEVTVHQRGNPGYQREVRDIAVDNVAADSLLAGETVNRPGQWSSYPPHKHDDRIPGVEARLEEVYFYKVNPAQGFGYQRVYTDDRSLDLAVTVENDDLVLLPRGYHPVAAAPGYSVYYFWALAGPERIMKPHDDPAHQWVATVS